MFPDMKNCLKQMAEKKEKQFRERKRKNPLELKELIKKTKVSILEQNFIRKLKRTIVYKNLPN
jgi:hypothetical protein